MDNSTIDYSENFVVPEYYRRKLMQLNLMDNFLFQEMLSQNDSVSEEFCRILLKTILGRDIRRLKIIPQKNILGIDTDKHGIRMDAYIEEYPEEENISDSALCADIQPDIFDIEPNRTYEKKLLPKRMRYYHGLLDTQLLASGQSYERLPRVVIIVILPYDPFDANRMVYTVENRCIEDSSIPYDDGITKIYLYTKGTEGNPSHELQDMLKYIEDSTSDNVTNDDLSTINNLVNEVKRRKEVNISYMKSWEYEKMIEERATRNGLAKGMAQGMEQGMAKGMAEGHAKGLAEGRAEGLLPFVQMCKEFLVPYEDTLDRIQKNFHLTDEEARSYMEKYW